MAPATKRHIVSDKLHSRVFDGKSIFPHAVSVEGKRMIFVSGQLAWDKAGALLVSDDTAGVVWRALSPGAKPSRPAVLAENQRPPRMAM